MPHALWQLSARPKLRQKLDSKLASCKKVKPVFAFLRKIFAAPEPFGSALYDNAVRQSRQPMFFNTYGVPDALDGRFDLIVLHLCLLRFALIAKGEEAGDGRLLQAMDERFVMDMDHALREIGVGDLSVGKQVKGMMAAYNGRWTAYRDAFDQYLSSGVSGALEDSVFRNVYRSSQGADGAAMTQYCQTQIDHLQDKAGLIRSAHDIAWAPWPASA